ncbi:class D beta-lactamase [Roseateles aquatilis]|nr:class D beta-lactamase [Roseateles aquatilis]
MTPTRMMAGGLMLSLLALTACRAALAQPAPGATNPSIAAASPTPAAQRERWETRPELQRNFSDLGTHGALTLLDTRAHRWIASDSQRAFEGFIPASTFKIPMSLIALETGAAADETQAFAWDGQKRSQPDWNRDQTLASAYKVSAVWVFQGLARQVGQPKVQQFLYDFRYGNAMAGPKGDSFWLDGGLRISTVGQIDFLRRLNERALPLSDRTYDIARKIMLRDQGPGWKMYAKTGWAGDGNPAVGWFVGWVEQERDPRPVYFALNMDMLKSEFGPRREEIVKRVMRSMGYLD